MKIMVGLVAAVALCAALYFARTLLVPVAFALFIIAVVWPLQQALQKRMPHGLATLLTLLITLAVVGAVTALIVWGLGRVGQWVFANTARFQAIYDQAGAWAEAHGFVLASLVTDNVDTRALLRLFQNLSGRVQDFGNFFVFTFLYVLLGLMEVEAVKSHLERRKAGEGVQGGTGTLLLAALADIAAKLQKYMMVRTLVSLATGVVVWAFTLSAGLELALAWGALAFALNYIPFIGPFVATLLPTLFALAQLGSWETALFVFICLNIIQFLSGSYIEPRITGATLAVSPFLMLFSVFFFAFLWGIAGAFIGVPILIAGLTLCAHHPSSRFIAEIFSGRPAPAPSLSRS